MIQVLYKANHDHEWWELWLGGHKIHTAQTKDGAQAAVVAINDYRKLLRELLGA